MAVGFFLKTPAADKSAIVVIVRYNGAIYKRAAGVSCETKCWNKKTHSVRRTHTNAAEVSAINARLRSIYDACNSVCMDMTQKFNILAPAAYWAAVDARLNRHDANALYVSDYVDAYIDRKRNRMSVNTRKTYDLLRVNLRKFEEQTHRRYRFEDIDMNFYNKLREYFVQRNMNLSYFGAVIKNLKVVYREARDIDGLHDGHATEQRGFSVCRSNTKSIYLTLDELRRMYEVDITEEAVRALSPEYATWSEVRLKHLVKDLDLSRKKFLIGAYTALRISDYNQLQGNNIDEQFIRVTTRKTGANVVIPIHPCVRAILESGFDFSQPITDKRLNVCIRIVARMAGITDLVEGTKIVEKRAVTAFFPKCDLVTSHTARRSAATNMYKAGIPAISIMRITGHTTEASFLRYIRISQEENAEMLAKSAFFR